MAVNIVKCKKHNAFYAEDPTIKDCLCGSYKRVKAIMRCCWCEKEILYIPYVHLPNSPYFNRLSVMGFCVDFTGVSCNTARDDSPDVNVIL